MSAADRRQALTALYTRLAEIDTEVQRLAPLIHETGFTGMQRRANAVRAQLKALRERCDKLRSEV